MAEVAYVQEVDKFKGPREEFHKELYIAWEGYMNVQQSNHD
ncbi:MAG: hypothetical protein Q8O83_00785 [bacterium]|nr:hypothetical protein [bacterium]